MYAINILIYGGGFKRWVDDLKKEDLNKAKASINISEDQPMHDFVEKFKNERKILHQLIIEKILIYTRN